MLLKACVNGARSPHEHPALPVTATAIATDVVRVVAAGADAVHLHVKDDGGADTLAASQLSAVLDAVRAVAPRTSIGVTTGAWAQPDPAARVAAVTSWTVLPRTALPDFASVNWHEDGADNAALVSAARLLR